MAMVDPLQTEQAFHSDRSGLSRRNLVYLKRVGKTSRRHLLDVRETCFKVRSSLSVSVRHGSRRNLWDDGGGTSRNSMIRSWSSSGKLPSVAMVGDESAHVHGCIDMAESDRLRHGRVGSLLFVRKVQDKDHDSPNPLYCSSSS